jgi:hypothetical protein
MGDVIELTNNLWYIAASKLRKGFPKTVLYENISEFCAFKGFNCMIMSTDSH